MNLLTPEQGSRLHQMDIETGRTVAEWDFQKDGVDVDMKDLINDTKGAAPLPPPPPPLPAPLHRCGRPSAHAFVVNLAAVEKCDRGPCRDSTVASDRDPTSVARSLSCSRAGFGQCCPVVLAACPARPQPPSQPKRYGRSLPPRTSLTACHALFIDVSAKWTSPGAVS